MAYLNGKEILRRDVKGDGPSASVSSHEAGGYEFFELSDIKTLLKQGVNILALVGHNTSIGSSDFTLDPYFVYVPERLTTAEAPRPTPTALDMWHRLPRARHASGSRRIVVFDRTTGQQLWKRDAVFNFRHNNIALTDDRVFCVDVSPSLVLGRWSGGALPSKEHPHCMPWTSVRDAFCGARIAMYLVRS